MQWKEITGDSVSESNKMPLATVRRWIDYSNIEQKVKKEIREAEEQNAKP